MLVLTREQGERVVFRDGRGRKIGELAVDRVASGRVRLGFEFDRSITIQRKELEERREEETP